MDLMGSPYLLAHGLGEPVADAVDAGKDSRAGKYRVWVRTRDWVAPWKAPAAPGRFQVMVDGKPLATTFGTEGAKWHWQDGGTVELAVESTIALHDLTGFEGRCDAILLCRDTKFIPPDEGTELDALRGKLLGWTDEPEDGGTTIWSSSAAELPARRPRFRPRGWGSLSRSFRTGRCWVATAARRCASGRRGKSSCRPTLTWAMLCRSWCATGRRRTATRRRATSTTTSGKCDFVGGGKKHQAVAEQRVNQAEARTRGRRAVVAQNTRTGRRTRIAGTAVSGFHGRRRAGRAGWRRL